MTNTTLPAITKSVIYDAPIEKVWVAVSTSEGIASWFMPNDFQPIEGHNFYIQSPFGPSPCKVLGVDPPNKLTFSWDEDGWVVSFELKDVSGKTEFTLTHDGWKGADDIVPKANQKQSVIHKTMSEGWEALVESNLRKVVEE
ncbi:SRPBCC domain-containing protein [Shimazuella sp. AN120528]|uniref:SRPBCC family protein n=1 Tax=Shimazuella soli TaxID=1892854 RepID=UPI001F0D86E1|nr:SRPBCC domain-containing protein [Shimazuella soli]MCH5585556.1 SRPBCC domain-containing protein [Shimazuella soli]